MKTKQSITYAFFSNIAIVILSSSIIILMLWLKHVAFDEGNSDSFWVYFNNIKNIELLLVFFFAVISSLIISQFLSRDLTQHLRLFTTYFEDASKKLKKIDTHKLKFQEFDELALSVNDMVDKVRLSQEEVKEQQRFLQAVLEAQRNIVFVITDAYISSTNKAFLDFFCVKNIKDFYNRHHELCALFVAAEEVYSGCYKEEKLWHKYIMEHPDEIHKVKLHKNDILYTFIVDARKITISKKSYVVVAFSDITQIEQERKMYEVAASTDALTGIANRLKFNTILEQQIALAKRYKNIFSLIIFDIDDFKRVNDTYGHKVGDDVLVLLSKTVRESIRESDTFARWGGEEFVLILPQTEELEAKEVAESLREKIAVLAFGDGFSVTCSFGVGEYKMQENSDIFMQEVDWLLYKAKHGGKNRVCLR